MSKIHKVLFWFVSISLSFIILAIGLFYLLRNDILFYVIQSINKSQPGEIVAEQIHLSPFYQFPYITLRLENISYFEKPGAKRKNNDLPICNIQSFYLSLDIIELVSGNLNVRNLTLEDGQVDLIAYEDGSTNINNALGASEDEPDSIEKMSDLNEKIEIEFEQVELKNLKISLENKFSGNRFQIVIDQLTIAFKYSGGSIFCNLISSFKIGEVQAKGYDFLSDKNIKSDLEFMFDLDSLILSLDSSQVIIDNGKLGVHGLVDLKNDGFVNLEVTAEETDLSLLSLFVEEEALRLNIKNEGTLVVNGRIRGKLLNHLPQLDLSFSGDKIDLAIPGTNKQVKSLGFSGKFFTGNSPDLSTAVLRLTKFEALVPGGQISGSLNIDNFVQPRIKLNLIGEADITGFHRLFKWDLFNSLGGEVLIDGDLNWIVDLKEQRLISRLGELRVKFKDVQCHLDDPEIKVDTLNGQLRVSEGFVFLDDLSLKTDSSDIIINGKITNLLYYFFGRESEIIADLSLNSERLSYVDFIGMDSLLAEKINQIHREMNLNFSLYTTRKGIDSSIFIPHGNIRIHNFTTHRGNKPDLIGLKGFIKVGPDSIILRDLKGIKGRSKIDYSIDITNYKGIILEDVSQNIQLKISINSPEMLVIDFFSIGDKIFFPTLYHEEILQNFNIELSLLIDTRSFYSEKLVPDFKLAVSNLQWKMKKYPLFFRDFHIDFAYAGDSLKINTFKGKISESDFNLSATLDNIDFQRDTIIVYINGKVNIVSEYMNLNQILSYQTPEADAIHKKQDLVVADDSLMEDRVNFFAIPFPNVNLILDMDSLSFLNYNFYQLRGDLSVNNKHLVELKKFSFNGAGGSIDIRGTLDAVNPELINVNNQIIVNQINIGNLDIPFQYEGKSISLGEHFSGLLDAQIKTRYQMSPDLTIDLEKTTATIKAILQKGRITDFPPFKELSVVLGTKDLNNVRFDKLVNTLEIKNNRLFIPRMNIASTLANMFFSGSQGFDNTLDYTIEIPFSMILGSAANAILSRERDEDDPEDEIQSDMAFLYVSYYIRGTTDNIAIHSRRPD